MYSKKNPTDSRLLEMQALWDSNSVATFSVPPLTTCYLGTAVQKGCKIWCGPGTVAGNVGLVTVYPTLDGTATGAALFTSSIMFAAVTGTNSASIATNSFGSLRTISNTRQAVSFTMMVGTAVGALGGNSTVYLASGSPVNVFLFGI